MNTPLRSSFPFLLRRAIGIQPWRFRLSALGISLSALLVLFLAAALRSATLAITAYIAQPGADIWIAPRGTDNLVRSSALLPLDYRDKVMAVPGVAAVDPIIVGFTVLRLDPEKVPRSDKITCIGIGYRSPDGLGGPPRIMAGAPPENFKDVLLDRAAAQRLGVHVGDEVTVSGYDRRVSGLTEGTNLAITHLLFGDYDGVAFGAGAVGQASFLIVRAKPTIERARLVAEIHRQVPELEVFDQATFLENCRQEIAAGYLPILTLVYVLGVAAAAALVSLLIHSLVEERRSDLAVLLALGLPLRRLWLAVSWQGLRLALIGSLLGIALAYGLGWVLDQVEPVFPVSFGVADAVRLVSIFSTGGLLAALIPVMRLRKLDPLDAFRS